MGADAHALDPYASALMHVHHGEDSTFAQHRGRCGTLALVRLGSCFIVGVTIGVLGSACSTDHEIELRVCADPSLGPIDELELSVLDDMVAPFDVELLSLEGVELPITQVLPAREGGGYVRVAGRSSRLTRLITIKRVTNFDDAGVVDMLLAADCYGVVRCPEGQTCVAGACVAPPLANEPPTCGAE